MRRHLPLLLALLFFGSTWAQQGQSTQEAPEEQVAPDGPTPVPRVVGQARSEAETDAWRLLTEARGDEQVSLAQKFLADFPDSGLTSYVHYTLANIYSARDDVENFITHGEKALAELPNLPDLLAPLSFYYSEQGLDLRAIQYAQRALDQINSMAKPDLLSAANWAKSQFELGGQAHYAIGRVHLARATSRRDNASSSEDLDAAMDHLAQALEQIPDNSYAAFRLAEAYQAKEDYDRAIDNFALTAAMGGVIESHARSKLQVVYQHVHQSTEGMEDVISRQKEIFAMKKAERQQMLEAIEREEQEATQDLSGEVSEVSNETLPDKPPV